MLFTFAECFLQINFISLDALSRNSEQIKLSEFLKRNKNLTFPINTWCSTCNVPNMIWPWRQRNNTLSTFLKGCGDHHSVSHQVFSRLSYGLTIWRPVEGDITQRLERAVSWVAAIERSCRDRPAAATTNQQRSVATQNTCRSFVRDFFGQLTLLLLATRY